MYTKQFLCFHYKISQPKLLNNLYVHKIFHSLYIQFRAYKTSVKCVKKFNGFKHGSQLSGIHICLHVMGVYN